MNRIRLRFDILVRIPLVAGLLVLGAERAIAQDELPVPTVRGSTVTPVYEGWYPNGDGTVTLSWGFFNRNSRERLLIPLGLDNAISASTLDGVQPTVFPPGRHHGVFGVVVPEAVSVDSVRWTLRIRGEVGSVPANLAPEWRIPGTGGDVVGNTPPRLAFAEDGPFFAGPAGGTRALRAEVGDTLRLEIHARDDGVIGPWVPTASEAGVRVTWLPHAGPVAATILRSQAPAPIPASGGRDAVTVVFTEPGRYAVRVRAEDDVTPGRSGWSQCCWTNALFRIEVTRSDSGVVR